MNNENKVVKISDVVYNQIPEFILSENKNFSEFLKQYYISQEFQGAAIDLAENLIDYKNIETFDTSNLLSETTLTSDVGFFDSVISVESTNGWPNQYGLLKIDDEIITYTGITSTSFTGCFRGFSGISSISTESNPEFLTFSTTSSSTHSSQSTVHNLSNLFIKEFFRKIKYQFTPGFENLSFDEKIDPTNFISRAKDFYQTKGTDEAYKILFKVLYAEDVKVVRPYDYTFVTSDDKWVICETFLCDLIEGDPTKISGGTLYQDTSNDGSILPASGSIYSVDAFYFKNKKYFKVNLFSGYSNNLSQKGSIAGSFNETPRTYVVENIASGSTTITVNSTIGFKSSGTIIIGGLTINYTEKTNNQFLNCSGVTSPIQLKSVVYGSNFVYSYENGSENTKVSLRILPSFSGIKETNALYSIEGDKFSVDNFGSLEDTTFTKSLSYNLPLTVFSGPLKKTLKAYDTEGISISNGLCRTKFNHKLKSGDFVDLYLTDFDTKIKSGAEVFVADGIENEFSVNVSGISSSYIGRNITAKRKLFKSRSFQYPEINSKYTADIQDSYTDGEYNYITSNGLPKFQINPYQKKFNFRLSPTDYETLVGSHNFNSGELVTVENYSIVGNYSNAVGLDTGVSFYVKKIDNNRIKLTYSLDSVGISSFINFSELVNPPVNVNLAGVVTSFTLVENNIFGHTFGSSKLFKKFPKTPKYSQTPTTTVPGSVGVLVNGIEIQNYKSHDKIYYGQIESIDVLNSGEGYDLLNPPHFSINGQTALYQNVLCPQLVGKLEDLVIVNSGFGYENTPQVTITGGGTNTLVKTEVKMKLSPKIINFNASSTAGYVSDINDSFTFQESHGLLTGDAILFDSFNNPSIGIGTQISDGNLTDKSVYYVINVGAGTSFKIAKTQEDAFNGNNIIIREYGSGSQRFTTIKKSQVIDKITVVDTDVEFKYAKIPVPAFEINSSDNIFTAPNHGFVTNDEVLYTFQGTLLYGLLSNEIYYIHKVDDNRFKLKTDKDSTSFIDIGISDLLSVHFFEYSPIRVDVLGQLSTGNSNELIGVSASIKPIVRGTVTKVLIANPTNQYGDPEILNYRKFPKIEELVGSGCNLQPLISEGKIQKVIVKNPGSNYYNSITLKVNGSGYGAKLEPIIVNGQITSITIVNAGVGYDSDTTIQIVPLGKGLKVTSNLKSWTLNEVQKIGRTNLNNGIILGDNYSQVGNIFGMFYLNPTLLNLFGIPLLSNNQTPSKHSPIIGWAYDGCPIYGPDGFVNTNGTGGLKRLRSSYKPNKKTFTNYPLVEDYEYNLFYGDLDEHNGRFCVTPEFPNGVYAYFYTCSNNGTPQFPYVIGDTYKYSIEEDNLNQRINQNIDLNTLNLSKHTLPYGVENKSHYYEYIDLNQNNLKDDVLVTNSSKGSIDNVLVIDGGENYKIGDSITFNNENTSGFGAFGKVSELSGVGITSITSSSTGFTDVEFGLENGKIVGITSIVHNILDNSYVRIGNISDLTYSQLSKFTKVSVPSVSTNLVVDLNDQTTTGLTTSIRVKESIFKFEIGDIIKVANEQMVVIGIDYSNNSLKVLRTNGGPAHYTSEEIILLNKRVYFEDPKITFLPSRNVKYYFNPSQSVCLGTSTAIGAGNTLTVSSNGIGLDKTKFLSSGRIFLPNHKFNTGDKVIYRTTGNPIIVSGYGSLEAIPELYVVKIDNDVIGLTNSLNLTSNTDNLLLYTFAENNDIHLLRTDRNVVTGSILYNKTSVTTGIAHSLSVGDMVNLNVSSGLAKTFTVAYNPTTFRLTINSQNNPNINAYENETLIFNVSSSSLNNCKLKFYADQDFENEYLGNQDTGLEIVRNTSFVKLTITDNTPKTLYYNIESPTKTVYPDESVSNFNTITIAKSLYNQKDLRVVGVTTTSFEVNYESTVERNYYLLDESTLSYNITSSNISSSINKVKLSTKGKDYKRLPKINLTSENGKNATLLPVSTDIGRILNSKVINNELIIPTDRTLSPYTNTYSSVFVSNNYQVDNLEIIKRGSNYLTPPTAILYSKENQSIISDFSAAVSITNGYLNNIQVINPSSGILCTDDKLVFTNNTNGIRILNASYSSPNKTVTLTLETPPSGFSTSNPLQFKIGDSIFVEGIDSVGNGYNSSDYDYEFFTVTGVTTAFGSEDAAQIQYYCSQNPGVYLQESSFNANVINSTNIPVVKVNLKENDFYSSESVDGTTILSNENNSPITSLLKVKQSDSITKDLVLTGKYSNSKGKVVKIENYNTSLKTDISAPQTIGWKKNQGNLSSVVQKLQDNDYYQRFSYSLKSNVQMSEWDSAVSDLSHVSGYKKFSDLSIDSVATGISSITTVDSSQVNISLESYVNVNTVNDFDLVTENIEDYGYNYSNEITFQSKILSDYLLSKENRVLKIDDISNLFDTDSIKFPKILVDQISNSKLIAKYIFFIQSSDGFLGNFINPMFFETLVSKNANNVNLSSYSYYYPNDIGNISGELSETDNTIINIFFTPVNPFNSLLFRGVKEEVQVNPGITTTSYGYLRSVNLTSAYSSEVTPTQKIVYSIPISEVKSGSMFVGISSNYKSIETSYELTFAYSQNQLEYNVYTSNDYSGIGTVGVSTSGSNVVVTYDGVSGIAATVYGIFNFITNTNTSPNEIIDGTTRLNSSRVTYSGGSPVSISSVFADYSASKYVIEVQKTVGLTTQVNLISVNSIHYSLEDYLYNVNYGIIGNQSDLNFSVIFDEPNNQYVLTYTPSESANYTITFFEKNILGITN